MNSMTKGLLVVLLHMGIVLSLGGKLLYDRAYRPRVWVRTASVDPDLPIRGRYLTLSLQVHAPDLNSGQAPKNYAWAPVYLTVENNQLVAHRAKGNNTSLFIAEWARSTAQAGADVYALSPPITFFLPEHAAGPIVRRGDELWAEVTIPKKGPPRPIQLALKSGTQWKPLTYR